MNAAPASIPPRRPTITAALRRILLFPGFRFRARRGLALRTGRRRGLLLRRGRFLRLRFRRGRCPPRPALRCWRRLDIAKRRLEVVEDETNRRIPRRRRRDTGLPVPDDEDAAFAGRHLELRQRTLAAPHRLGGTEQLSRGPGELLALPRIPERRACHRPRLVEDDGSFDLRGDLGQVGERLLCVHRSEAYGGSGVAASAPFS